MKYDAWQHSAVYLNNCLFLAHICESLKKILISGINFLNFLFVPYKKTYPHHNLSRKYVPTNAFHHPSIHLNAFCIPTTHIFKQDEICIWITICIHKSSWIWPYWISRIYFHQDIDFEKIVFEIEVFAWKKPSSWWKKC